MRILVADDSPEVADRIADLLLEAGATEIVGPAHDGTAALSLFRSSAPDAAVLDLQMPGLDGLTILRLIRASGPNPPVVILTTHAEPELRDACLAAGADHFLGKSTDFERLADIVVEWLEGRNS